MLKHLVILALFAVAVPPIPRQTADNSAGSGGNIQNQHEQSNPKSQLMVSPLPEGSARPAKPDAEQEHAENKENAVALTSLPPVTIADKRKTFWDYLYDWGPWVFACLLTVVGFLQAGLLYGTLKAIKRQGDAMEISERAWLLITPVRPRHRHVDKDGVAEFFWVVKNVGNTPATLIDTQARFEVLVEDELADVPDYGEKMCLNERTLAPGGSVRFHAKWTERKKGRHVRYVLREGSEDILVVCGYGRIEYRNTFGQTCESRFCSNVFLNGNEFRIGFLPNFDAPPVYTKHT